MENLTPTFKKILDNNAKAMDKEAMNVLILFEDKRFFIGDNFIRVDSLRSFRSFFKKAHIHINFGAECNSNMYDVLLKNNPNMDSISISTWDDISFEKYDMVFCILDKEDKLLEFLHEKYGEGIHNGQPGFAVFSMSAIVLGKIENASYIFPMNNDLVEYVNLPEANRPRELYMDKEEREWGNHWLETQGVKDNENLFILLDATTSRSKLLNLAVYFEFLSALLGKRNSKILVFDEKNIGKEAFYREWVGDEGMEKIIFAKGLGLRAALCILSSRYTRLVFGPCTGLLHCASGIYNYYLKDLTCRMEDVPVMVTYTGQYPPADANAAFWWKNSPLVDCLLLKGTDNNRQIVLLSSLSEEEKKSYPQVPCSEYTAEMLTEFVNARLRLNN
jgi:hypothetical protein